MSMTSIFLDNVESFVNSSNILAVPYDNVAAAFKDPVAIISTNYTGFDWTKPFPGTPLDGHQVYLTVSQEVPVSEDIVQNATTILSSLTFQYPSAQGHFPEMDPSWYICRHIFISTKPQARAATVGAGGKCGFLPDDCLADLKALTTGKWGKADKSTMCSSFVFQAIPESCVDSFGYSRQDVMAFGSKDLDDPTWGPLQLDKSQQQYSWRMGTGFRDPGGMIAYDMAVNRTYLVATVWGFARDLQQDKVNTPEVSFSCLTSPEVSIDPGTSPSKQEAYYEDFSSGDIPSTWNTYDGSWDAKSKALEASTSIGSKAVISKSSFSDFIYEADVTLPSRITGDAGLLFRISSAGDGDDAYDGYYAGISAQNFIILGKSDVRWTQLGRTSSPIDSGKRHHVKIHTHGHAIDYYVDNMTSPKLKATDGSFSKGMAGVRTLNTSATFDNIEIFPQVFADDFSHGTDSWDVSGASFSTESGALVGSSPSPEGKALITGLSLSDFIAQADITLPVGASPSGNAGLAFHVSNPDTGVNSFQGYVAYIAEGSVALGRVDNNWTELGRVKAGGEMKSGQTHHMFVRVSHGSILVFVDNMDEPRINITDKTFTEGSIGVRVYKTAATIDNVKVYAL